ncbi:MAG TPA: helix-turn-helix transcriptional regulator [Pseudonocardiaceae bacterium]|jgi:transcriptional regulator with XRE-family HTH domain|nr:helix-turn-helix transcriptional regulator [Pseudonocardiaceae bacterium]
MAVNPDPDLINMQIGIELRRLREEAGYTAAEAAEVIKGASPKISKLENGNQGALPDEIRALVTFYRASREHRDYLIELAEQRPTQRRRRGSGRDAVPDWFRRFLALEWEAAEISTYQIDTVHGLLQTEDYMRSTISAWEPDAAGRLIDQQVVTRLNRQQVLRRTGRPSARIEVILSEAALRRVQGNVKIMKAQLDHLVKISKRPNITLRIIPFDKPDRIAVLSSFTLFRLPEQKLSMVYLEDVLGATYLKEPEEFTAYASVFSRLRSSALDPDSSREFIAKVAASYR